MAGQLVVGGGEPVPEGAELGAAHRLLAVLNAHADGEGLALHGQAQLVQHLEGVPGGVAGGQDQGVAGEGAGAALRLDGEGGEAAVHPGQPDELVAEADVCPQAEQLAPDGFHHVPQHVGADVGLVRVFDVGGRAVGDEHVKDVGDAGVVHPGGELAVGKGARAALAELDVGGGGELGGLPEVLHVPGAGVHVPAPLQDNGAQPRPGQGEGGEQARRAHAHHHGAGGGGAADGGEDVGGVGHLRHPLGGAAEDGGFVLQGDPDGADQADVGFPPGVDGLTVEGEGLELAWGDPEGLGGGLAEKGLVPADGEDEIVHLQHGGVPSLYIM